MADNREGILKRNLNTIAAYDTDLAVWAAHLVRHFGSPDNYTCVGSDARDEQARLDGEFKLGYDMGEAEKPQAEINAMALEMELAYA